MLSDLYKKSENLSFYVLFIKKRKRVFQKPTFSSFYGIKQVTMDINFIKKNRMHFL